MGFFKDLSVLLGPGFAPHVCKEQGGATSQPAMQIVSKLNAIQPGDSEVARNLSEEKFCPGFAVIICREGTPRRHAVVGGRLPGYYKGGIIRQEGKILDR